MRRQILSAIMLSIAAGCAAFSQTSWTICSPDSTVQAKVQLANLSGTADFANAPRLYFSVSIGNTTATEVVPTSPMGIVRTDMNFVDSLAFDSVSAQRTIDSVYTMVTGKRSICRNYCNEKILTFHKTAGTAAAKSFQVIIRAYDNGFAFRYCFPETSTSSYTVKSEESGIRVPSNYTACIMPYDIYGTYQPGYENYWNNNIAAGTLVSGVTICGDGASGWAMPALFKSPAGYYALFFETDVTPNYCGTHLREPSSCVYRIALPLAAESNGIGSATPSWMLPWTMPWRVVAVASTPAGILEQTLASDLATPSKITDVSWIHPGRASWSWWSNEDVTQYSNVTPFIDMAKQFTWEYSLVDANWPSMAASGGGTWQNLLTYATGKNVSLILWYNSGGTNSTVDMAPRDRMSDSATRCSEMSTISTAGIKGIKVDFFHGDKQWIIKYYNDIMRDAATYHIAVNFHGCTVPRGWQRTWPNLMSMESVRGEEYYKYDAGYPAAQPARNTILPFTRNAVASMDYTPVGFTSMANEHVTTYGHELALAVVFESGILHFCDQVSAYTSKSVNVRDFMSTVPTAWDDTKWLSGTPGTYLVIARKKGYNWYIGGINGQSATQSVTVPLSFIQAETNHRMLRIADGTSNTTFNELLDTVLSTESITVSMRGNGGFVARLVNMNPVQVEQSALSKRNKGIATAMFLNAGDRFILPKEWAGKKLNVRMFGLNGRLIATAAIKNRTELNLRNDFSSSTGVHILKLREEF